MAEEIYQPTEEQLNNWRTDSSIQELAHDYATYYNAEYLEFAKKYGFDPGSPETEFRFSAAEAANVDGTEKDDIDTKAAFVNAWVVAGRPDVAEWRKANPTTEPKTILEPEGDSTPVLDDVEIEYDEIFMPSEDAIKEYLNNNKPLQEQMMQYANFYNKDYAAFIDEYNLKDNAEAAYRFYLATNISFDQRVKKGAEERWNAVFAKDYFAPSPAAVATFLNEDNKDAQAQVEKYASFYGEEYKKFCETHGIGASTESAYRFYLADTRTASGEMNPDSDKKWNQAMSMDVFTPTPEAVEAFVNGDETIKKQIETYAKFYGPAYDEFLAKNNLEDGPAAHYRFYLAETYEVDGTQKSDAQEKWNKALESLSKASETRFEENVSLTSGKKGAALQQSTPLPTFFGTIEQTTSQEIVLKNNGGNLPIKTNQKLFFFTQDKSDTTAQLLTVSQGNKPVASFYQGSDGKMYLAMSKESAGTFFEENEELKALALSTDGDYYAFSIEQLNLSEGLNIEDVEIKGTDGKSFMVNFSALGYQFKTKDGKRIAMPQSVFDRLWWENVDKTAQDLEQFFRE